ncbi:MAG TPA: arabinan endo-1,5-alpha-L-arabinosidase [Polyangiaceae bacterium]|nr:arabinan endo-1,5-alpha-L-arabinosidase [Polyangiaceae bacterium]
MATSNGGNGGGGAPTAGASGAGAATSGGSGGTATGGDGGASTNGGSSAGGGGGTAGAAGGGMAGMAGGGGSAGPDPDRCDIANYDPDDPPEMLPLTGPLGTHDPVLIHAHGRYYLFQTGGNQGLNTKTSEDLLAWQDGPTILAPNPSWVSQHIQNVMNLWAPDISYFNGQYHLYYSASTFGSNHSCIGHATRPALDEGEWDDHGPVICSNEPGPDHWNAIDPNVAFDEDGTPWLSFGSFWGGLKLIRLDENGARADQMLHSIAARPDGGDALEAPFIVRRCGYYYLFLSFDSCCKGTNSTYKIMVGRATAITGPYVDKAGTPLMQGGGTLLVQGDGTKYAAAGHNAVVFTDDAAYNIYHAYSQQSGDPVLRIAELVWDDDGWPISAGP